MTSEDFRMTTTPHECVDALHHAVEQLGESPTKAQYEELGVQPASATIVRTMGGWNEAKRKAGFETTPSRGPRTGPMPDHLDVTEDEWTAMSVDQRWHFRNAEWNAERSLRRRARLRRWLHEYKQRNGGCTRCGEEDPACIDFHHVDGARKEMAVTKMIPFGYSREDIRAEVGKCVLLCANCHRKEHHDLPDTGDSEGETRVTGDVKRTLETREELRQWSYDYRRANGCRMCDAMDTRCLQFHHVDPVEKEMGVGSMISRGYPPERILEEVELCDVLCANCHRKEHYDVPRPSESDRV